MSIYDLTIEELSEYFLQNNDKKFYATELFSWLYNKKITSFDEASNIKKEVRDRLKKDFIISNIDIITVEEGRDVKKYLFKLSDFEHIDELFLLLNKSYII